MTSARRPQDDPLAQPAAIDLAHLRTWVGKTQLAEDEASVRHARLMSATLGWASRPLEAGDPVPPLWHWIYFLEGRPPGELGEDGHPARGGFLPPVPLPNRMWAGGRVDFLAPIALGAHLTRRSQVTRVDHKTGRSGDLVFVTVLHELRVGDRPALREDHDIVYKSATKPGLAAPDTLPAKPFDHEQLWQPDTTQLFRYSALTFNSHRIHYDLDYCREVEGYDNLVVHGPLTATLLAGLAARHADAPLSRFVYRGLRPFTLGKAARLKAKVQGDGSWALWSELPDGSATMEAQATATPQPRRPDPPSR